MIICVRVIIGYYRLGYQNWNHIYKIYIYITWNKYMLTNKLRYIKNKLLTFKPFILGSYQSNICN